jgi:hypothetical protein
MRLVVKVFTEWWHIDLLWSGGMDLAGVAADLAHEKGLC